MLDLAENPGTAVGCTTYHHTIHTIAVEHLASLCSRVNIAIADDGDMDCGVILDLADKRPICLATVELCAGAPVNREGSDADILQAQGNLLDILRLLVPAKAGFDCHGLLYGIDNLARHLDHKRHIAHHSRAGTSARNLLHRAAEVDVDNVGIGTLGYAGSLDHRLDKVTVDLDAHRALGIVDVELCTRLPRIAN